MKTTSPSRVRSKNLDDGTVLRIVEIIDLWPHPKLTWNDLIHEVFLSLRIKYTRQALNNHARITEAYKYRKCNLPSTESQKADTPEQARIHNLEEEIARLRRENNSLLEQFNRWVYNGHLKQLDEFMDESMNDPLPPLSRNPTIKPKRD
ncbi:hypothetical protein ACIPK7_25630 [Pseudomonas sp. NPDC086581]|uniref:hypothetical protein n=1 Tax=Pseudomonas sp. NPDC086581 TaxID=3364432 RepID=UPI00380A6B5C